MLITAFLFMPVEKDILNDLKFEDIFDIIKNLYYHTLPKLLSYPHVIKININI